MPGDDRPPRRRFRWRWWRHDRPAESAPTEPTAPSGPVTTSDLLNQTMAVQQQSIMIVADMERQLGVADEQATAAAERLARTREVMNRAESEAVQAAPVQQQVAGETEALGRKVYRDKCCMVLTSLVVLMLIAVIIVEYGVKPDKGPAAVDAPGNATAVNTTGVNATLGRLALFQ